MTKMQDLFDLSDRIAIVTGGSRGIGKSIAMGLANHGAHVVIASRKLAACETLAAEIQKNGGTAFAVASNAGDLESVEALVKHVMNEHGRLDILINNAAANPWFGPIIDLELPAYEKTVDVNIRGALFTSILAARAMRDAGGGTIVNTGSVNGRQPVLGQGIYSITKGALETMTRSLAKEWAEHGIRVNALLPGVTKTDALDDLFRGSDELPPALKAAIPLARHASPDEMAGAAIFLASDASSFVTGECIVVDGGWTI